MTAFILHFFAQSQIETIDTVAETAITQPPEFQTLFLKTMLLVGALLALTFLALWMLKRVGGGRFEAARQASIVSVIERKALTPKVSIWVVEIDDPRYSQRYMIVESNNAIHVTNMTPNQGELTP